MKEIGIGLIGANWMGSYHSVGLTNVRHAYQDILPVFVHVADVNVQAAETAAKRFGYQKASGDWRDVIKDPDVDMVVVATPNNTHAEITIAAAQAGKHILCEKPMSNTLEESRAMVEAVKKAGVKSLVDFIYTKCPANVLARDLVKAGKLGDFVTFRGEFDCSYCADPNTPATWRQIAKFAGTGALGDLTAHIVSLSDMVVGQKIVEVLASWDTAYTTRPEAGGKSGSVNIDTDDQVYAIVKYEDGRIGSMSSSRISVARPDSLYYEMQGSNGAIKFDLTRINEIQYFNNDCDPAERGYKTIKGNVLHGDYTRFCATDELGIAYGDVLAIQAHDLLSAIANDTQCSIDIAYGHYVDTVMAAMAQSAKKGGWVKVSDLG